MILLPSQNKKYGGDRQITANYDEKYIFGANILLSSWLILLKQIHSSDKILTHKLGQLKNCSLSNEHKYCYLIHLKFT